jgi:hypothetical protein
VQTVEQTSKKYKVHMLIGAGVACVSMVGCCAGPMIGMSGLDGSQDQAAQDPALLAGGMIQMLSILGIVIGTFWAVGAKMVAWWHHG